VFTSFLIFFGLYALYRIHKADKKLSENTIAKILFWLSILTVLLIIAGVVQTALTLVPLSDTQINTARNFFAVLNVLFIIYIAFLAEEIGNLGETFGFRDTEKEKRRPKPRRRK